MDNLTALAALAVLVVEQILKLRVVPIDFANNHPVITNILLSIVASVVVTRTEWSTDNWKHILLNVATIATVAAIVYNQLIGKSQELKQLEG